MIIYWISLFTVGYFAITKPKSRWNKSTSFFIWFFLVVFIGFRFQVGCDWDQYILAIDNLRIPFVELISNKAILREPLYKLLGWFVGNNNFGVYGLNIFAASIFSYGLISFCKKTKRPWLTLLVAIPYFVIVMAMGYTKQSIAMGILLIGYVKLIKKETYQFIYYCFIASLFHISSLITLPIILPYLKIRKKADFFRIIIVFLVFASLISVLLYPHIERFLIGYVEQIYESEGSYLRFSLIAVPTLLFVFLRNRIQANDSELKFLNSICYLTVILGILLFFLKSTTIIDRLLLYIIPIQLYIIGNFSDFNLFNFSKKITTFFIFLYCILVQYIWLSYANHAICWIPYKNILFPF